jgi:hypothetical protein
MLQARCGLDLLHEPLGAKHRGELGAQDFQCDLAIVLEILGKIHRCHAAGTEFFLNGVAVG